MVDLKYSFYTRMRSALIVSDRLNIEDSYSIIVIISMFCKIFGIFFATRGSMERSCFTTIWCAVLKEMAECMSEPRFNGGFCICDMFTVAGPGQTYILSIKKSFILPFRVLPHFESVICTCIIDCFYFDNLA